VCGSSFEHLIQFLKVLKRILDDKPTLKIDINTKPKIKRKSHKL